MTPFAIWLTRQMRLNGFGKNQSKLATYLGTGSSTVGAWFTRDAIPGPDMCKRLAAALRIPEDEVLRAAGHLGADEQEDGQELPPWLRDMLPLLSQLDESESPVLEHSARAVLEMRELRATYDGQSQESPQQQAPGE